MAVSNDQAVWTVVPYKTNTNWTLDPAAGTKTVYVKFQDNAGNWSAAGATTDSIILEYTAPTGSLTISGGLTHSNSLSIELLLSAADANGVTQMQFSNDAVNWTTPEPVSAAKQWVLQPGDGSKTVYVRYKDAAGNWSSASAISSTIILDTTPPTGSATINAGESYANSSNVLLALQATDFYGLSEIQLSNDANAWSGTSRIYEQYFLESQ